MTLENKIILFVVEGPSDEDALIVPLEKELNEKRIKVKTEVLYTDILTKYISKDSKEFQITKNNVIGELKKIIKQKINKEKFRGIKIKDIGKIIYITDTDNCFFKEEHSKNKKECLKVLFKIDLFPIDKKEISFKVIFMSQNLEHVIIGELQEFSDDEKREISNNFSKKCEEDFNKYVELFESDEVKKWETYEKAYHGIEETNDRASNMNCLLLILIN